MTASAAARGPNHAASRGSHFFLRAIQTYVIDDAKGELLAETAQTLDVIDWLGEKVDAGDLRAVVEVRQQRMLLTRLLTMLDLKEEDVDGPRPAIVSPRTARARKAARSKWSDHVKRADLPK